MDVVFNLYFRKKYIILLSKNVRYCPSFLIMQNESLVDSTLTTFHRSTPKYSGVNRFMTWLPFPLLPSSNILQKYFFFPWLGLNPNYRVVENRLMESTH